MSRRVAAVVARLSDEDQRRRLSILAELKRRAALRRRLHTAARRVRG